MTKIVLIVTGDLELRALAASLVRFFPSVSFRVEKVDSITSTTISAPPAKPSLREGGPAWKLIDRLWRAVARPEQTGEREADFAIAIDDAELYNLAPRGDPARIGALVRAITERYLSQRFSDEAERTQYGALLRAKCSFHLLSPMVETYFFGDRDALTRAGVPNDRHVLRVPGDLEEFKADDPEYSLPASEAWKRRRTGRRDAGINPDQHPKDYLNFLRDPNAVTVDDSRRGVDALGSLRWEALTAVPSEVPFLRSLFEDLAEITGAASPLGEGVCHPVTCPDRSPARIVRMLRNL